MINRPAYPFNRRWLAPGLFGDAHTTPDGGTWIDLLEAVEPGAGAVGSYLDRLPQDKPIVVAIVLSPVLRQMLIRRGFIEAPPPYLDYWVHLPE